MDVDSPEAAEWSRLMKLTSEQEHEITRLRGALSDAISDLLRICDGSNWPENAQNGPVYEAYSEITEQLHDIAGTLQGFQQSRAVG